MKNETIFATGGWGDAAASVERYFIARDVWEAVPQLNLGRKNHSSCTLGTAVYVVCGNGLSKRLNSLEKLETKNLQAGWQLIEMPPTSLLTPRIKPVVAALNSSELLILGGYEYNCLAEVIRFDTRYHSVEMAAQNAPFKFQSHNVQLTTRPGVFAVVQIQNKKKPFVIKYEGGTFRILRELF